MNYPTLQVKDKSLKSLERKHPWVFSGGLNIPSQPIEDGSPVFLTKGKKVLATGHYANGSIAVRILDFSEKIIDKHFYEDKIGKAIKLRSNLDLPSDKTNAFRLIHGEGDGLPGLIVDIYGEYAVIQMHSSGMHRDLPLIRKALEKHEIAKFFIPLSAEKGAQIEIPEHLADETEILEHGLKFKVNWATGQKTGFFLDQRENRRLLGEFSKGKKVLNAFSYTGGFSIYALANGAREVHSLDSSKKATAGCEAHVALNGFDPSRHRAITEDALRYLSAEQMRKEAYDLIVLDPPAFAKHRSARHKAVQAYKRINALAMKTIAPGGILFTFSCSQVVTPDLFNHTIASAAMETGRNIRILQHLHQPPDHPVSIFHPEGEYLKGLLLQVE
jgi:23S rRNA (cytosine1962-C5)-methyltransferase